MQLTLDEIRDILVTALERDYREDTENAESGDFEKVFNKYLTHLLGLNWVLKTLSEHEESDAS